MIIWFLLFPELLDTVLQGFVLGSAAVVLLVLFTQNGHGTETGRRTFLHSGRSTGCCTPEKGDSNGPVPKGTDNSLPSGTAALPAVRPEKAGPDPERIYRSVLEEPLRIISEEIDGDTDYDQCIILRGCCLIVRKNGKEIIKKEVLVPMPDTDRMASVIGKYYGCTVSGRDISVTW